jgi:hypothetical protein
MATGQFVTKPVHPRLRRRQAFSLGLGHLLQEHERFERKDSTKTSQGCKEVTRCRAIR